MKKYIRIVLAALAAGTFCFAAAAKPRVVATLFPYYDWTREIIGSRADHIELEAPLTAGVDLHSFQPSVDDILRVSSCDLFIYTGGLSDAWVERVLRDPVNKKMLRLNMIAALGERARAEEIVEGMEAGRHHGHEHADHDDHDKAHAHREHEEDLEHHEGEKDHEHEKAHDHHEHDKDHAHHDDEIEYDEHVWLSLVNARLLCGRIAETLCGLDPEGAAVYRANAAACIARLDALHAQYRAAVAEAKQATLLFADRFPFRYLVDDYGLTYYAAFQGCSAESEASFKTVMFLAGKLKELQLPAVLTIEGSDKKIAQTVMRTAGRDLPILALDSMQSVQAGGADGFDYMAVMERNLSVLKEALK